jgi:hypothetical protein
MVLLAGEEGLCCGWLAEPPAGQGYGEWAAQPEFA